LKPSPYLKSWPLSGRHLAAAIIITADVDSRKCQGDPVASSDDAPETGSHGERHPVGTLASGERTGSSVEGCAIPQSLLIETDPGIVINTESSFEAEALKVHLETGDLKWFDYKEECIHTKEMDRELRSAGVIFSKVESKIKAAKKQP